MKSNQYRFFCIPMCFLISSVFFYHHLCMASYSHDPLGIHKHPQNVKTLYKWCFIEYYTNVLGRLHVQKKRTRNTVVFTCYLRNPVINTLTIFINFFILLQLV